MLKKAVLVCCQPIRIYTFGVYSRSLSGNEIKIQNRMVQMKSKKLMLLMRRFRMKKARLKMRLRRNAEDLRCVFPFGMLLYF